MRLYFIAIFVAISLLFHQNCLYANAGKTDTKGGSQDQNTGEDHFRRGNDVHADRLTRGPGLTQAQQAHLPVEILIGWIHGLVPKLADSAPEKGRF